MRTPLKEEPPSRDTLDKQTGATAGDSARIRALLDALGKELEGHEDKSILRIQNCLNERRADIQADEFFGNQTEEALKYHLQEVGPPADARQPVASVLDALHCGVAARDSVAVRSGLLYDVLKQESQTPRGYLFVRAVQRALRAVEDRDLAIDGKTGEQTKAALASWIDRTDQVFEDASARALLSRLTAAYVEVAASEIRSTTVDPTKSLQMRLLDAFGYEAIVDLEDTNEKQPCLELAYSLLDGASGTGLCSTTEAISDWVKIAPLTISSDTRDSEEMRRGGLAEHSRRMFLERVDASLGGSYDDLAKRSALSNDARFVYYAVLVRNEIEAGLRHLAKGYLDDAEGRDIVHDTWQPLWGRLHQYVYNHM